MDIVTSFMSALGDRLHWKVDCHDGVHVRHLEWRGGLLASLRILTGILMGMTPFWTGILNALPLDWYLD